MALRKKIKNKILSALLAVILVITSISFTTIAYANSQMLVLDVKQSVNMSGVDDLEWFYFTPSTSGTYSLLSYTNYATEAYLFIKEVNPETKRKEYIQLEYSNSDPDYLENQHGNRQFRLTYHLEAGITYHYAVGWYLSETRTSGVMTVMLRNDSYDTNDILSIQLGTPPTLDAYSDGNWLTDANGESFFRYNISKITSNLSITLNYSDGTSTTATGTDNIDGYLISFIDNQYTNHWYPNNSTQYTGNIFTVKVNDVTATVDIPIAITSQYSVKGKVIDMNGKAVTGAGVYISGRLLAETDSDGKFSFYHNAGQYEFVIKTTHSIERHVIYSVSTVAESNDHTSTPVQICNCDFVNDGVINTKDFAFINKYASEDDKPDLLAEFSNCINFTEAKYQ